MAEMKPRTVDETYSILREIDADRRRAEAGMWLSLAKMERRDQFWRGVGLVAAGVLIMLGNRERGASSPVRAMRSYF